MLAGRREARVRAHGLLGEAHRAHRATLVDVDCERREALAKHYPLFERLLDLFVIEGVRRAVDQTATVRDRRSAPRAQQLDQSRRLAGDFRARPLLADGSGVREKFIGKLALGVIPAPPHLALARLGGESLVAQEEFLDLHHVVGERLRRRVDRRQAAADHHHRKPHLHVRDRSCLGRTRQLQGHEEIRRRAHATRQTVGNVEHRRLAGPDADRDVVETVRHRVFERDRAAEAHAADHREVFAPLEQETNDLEEVLVPAHGDAVLGNAAESRHDPVGERLGELAGVAYRLERNARPVETHAGHALGKRLDLETIDAEDGVALHQQLIREPEAGGSETDDQNFATARGRGQRAAEIQRIPTREQRVDLEAPRQARARL